MDLEEPAMLEETVREWEKKLRKEGRQEGLIEGFTEIPSAVAELSLRAPAADRAQTGGADHLRPEVG
jgi:hypothetical protein